MHWVGLAGLAVVDGILLFSYLNRRSPLTLASGIACLFATALMGYSLVMWTR